MAVRKPQFSIVIPTLNEEKYLPQLLEDLAEQTEHNFEVIVVDAHSDDATIENAQKFSPRLSLTVLNSPKRNVSHQRNLGAAKARAPWVLFMDADDELPSYFVQGISYQLEKKPETDVFTCWVDVVEDANSSIDVNRSIRHAVNLFMEMGALLPNPQALGGFIGCRKSVLKKHSFDETQSFLEDGMFIRELVQAGSVFTVFREPKWFFSLRRIKKEGSIKLFSSMATYQIKYLMGGDFSKKDSTKLYPMLGGSYYDDVDTTNNPDFLLLKKMQQFIVSAPEKQLAQAKRLLQKIKDYEF
jgi:glycosyltransferase involved in cell wall biosynthesis